MLFTTASIAVLGFASYANAHMKMAKPVPFAASTLDNSPLDASGANFPCKLLFDTTTPSTQMALGSTQPLDFIGGATHGGGSCQISITYDTPPTKNSVFKVIHSIEGGCPIKNNPGNVGTDASAPDPDTYSFPIPTNLPTGKATLAWTWFNKVGNREIYMNCAPIALTGGSAKRSDEDAILARNLTELMERDQNAFNALPDMFVANLAGISNGCATVEGIDLTFPNAGASVEHLAGSYNPGGPVGCTGGSAQATGAAAIPSSPPAGSAGVFATLAPTSAAAATAAATTVATATAAASQAPVATPSAAPASSSPSSSSASGAQPAGSACSPEGQWNCIGGTSFQRCASGQWSVTQSLAAGTTCQSGISSTINITANPAKRAIRFSSEHVRRHLHKST